MKEKDEASQRLKSLIKDWALSHSTLEEVFMRVILCDLIEFLKSI